MNDESLRWSVTLSGYLLVSQVWRLLMRFSLIFSSKLESKYQGQKLCRFFLFIYRLSWYFNYCRLTRGRKEKKGIKIWSSNREKREKEEEERNHLLSPMILFSRDESPALLFSVYVTSLILLVFLLSLSFSSLSLSLSFLSLLFLSLTTPSD